MRKQGILAQIDAYWRAANYLSVGQIYLQDNPLLKKPLLLKHIKARLLGHWGTTPGLNFIYAHLNRLISQYDLNAILITGPGHGAPGIVANTYLEGSYSERYPKISRDEAGLRRLFRQFSFPGGIPSHTAPTTPGSINEGGELGYGLAHAFGAAFDNPDLLVACVIGDGEAETGTTATSWHSNKFLNPADDGAVLPILHLNGYKIANPTVLARIPALELIRLFEGYGYDPIEVDAVNAVQAHRDMMATLDRSLEKIRHIQKTARTAGFSERPRWPMIILRSPKGWTGPKTVDGLPVEGTWRAHQVPLKDFADNPSHIQILEDWLRSYRPEELFDKLGRPQPALAGLTPQGNRRMGANPVSNGGQHLLDLELPPIDQFAIELERPGQARAEATRVLGDYLRAVMEANIKTRNFRVFGPDETASNRLTALFEVTGRRFTGEVLPTDENETPDGRVMEVLSENLCQGWLEGYLLTGRHGLFSCYEAFTHIVDSMLNQHAKWLKVAHEVPWRAPIASLNYLLTSHVWRQDHNGFSHQDPGFINHVANKKGSVVRIYMPPDANTLLAVAETCLASRDLINVIVAGKQPELQWLNLEDARRHCSAGMGIWQWAGNERGGDPDLILACAGDVPTMEALAAVDLLRIHLPKIRTRVVNVVELMALAPADEHPHGWEQTRFEEIFPPGSPVLFTFHGYRSMIRNLTYRRSCSERMHVFGYKEEGTTTTPFDMAVLNGIDRFNLVLRAIECIYTKLRDGESVKRFVHQRLKQHRQYIEKHGKDIPEIRNWQWPYQGQSDDFYYHRDY